MPTEMSQKFIQYLPRKSGSCTRPLNEPIANGKRITKFEYLFIENTNKISKKIPNINYLNRELARDRSANLIETEYGI